LPAAPSAKALHQQLLCVTRCQLYLSVGAERQPSHQCLLFGRRSLQFRASFRFRIGLRTRTNGGFLIRQEISFSGGLYCT
jgi:hypothetical protein